MSHAGQSINIKLGIRHTDYCQNLNSDHLPETFSIRDEQVGVWWVTMAARHLYRSRTVSGS